MKAWIARTLASFVLVASVASWTQPVRAQTVLPAPTPTGIEAQPPPVQPAGGQAAPAQPRSPSETVAPAGTGPASTSQARRQVALVAAGVAAVGAAVGTVFGVLAVQNKSDYSKGPTYANADQGNNDAAYADGGIALAVAAGITSLVLFLTSGTSQDGAAPASASSARSANLSASPLVTSHGAGAGILLQF